MTTTADLSRDEAKEQIEKAIENLSGIVVTRTTSGHDDFSAEYLSKMRTALNHLLDARDLI